MARSIQVGFRFDGLIWCVVLLFSFVADCAICAGCGSDPECDDGLFCNGVEVCTGGNCQPGSNPCPGQFCDEESHVCVECLVDTDCVDGNPCTEDRCIFDFCVFPGLAPGTTCGDPSDTDCDNPDSCDGAGLCLANNESNGTPCTDDGNECTSDMCTAGVCTHPPRPSGAPCGNPSGTVCDNPDSCNGAGVCLNNNEPNGTGCDDGDFCSVGETCSRGVCAGGAPNDCDDGRACSIDSCDEVKDECVYDVSACPPDCNANLIDDPCDISCGPGKEACDVPGCGNSQDCDGNNEPDECQADCNGNNIPDECDITDCVADPACDDCNLNGVPDACDIADMSSEDADMDGVPDECVGFTGLCGPTDIDWSCVNNWDLGGVYPDNSGPATYSVTLDQSDAVFQDVALVTIDTLRMLDSSVLKVTQSGGGDLCVVAPGGLLLEGTILIAGSRTIDIPGGPVVIQDGGQYRRDPAAAPGSVSAVLSSQRVDILPGGALRLEDSMSLTVADELRLECLTECDGLRGGQTPPILQSVTGQAYVQGNAVLTGTVTWGYSSSAPLELAGSFVNHCTSPEGFDFVHGAMLLNGTTEQRFEVAGDDLGAIRDGFFHPVGLHSNFAMGTLDVAAGLGREVIFENDFANIIGASSCDEALYVHHLILRSGSHITLADCKIYYETLDDEGATITTSGCGQLSAIPACTLDSECGDGSACYHDECVAGACQLTRVEYGDVDGSGGASPVDLDDILCVLDGFANFAVCFNGDLVPCVPNGGIDLDDILAVLDAFGGADPCNCP